MKTARKIAILVAAVAFVALNGVTSVEAGLITRASVKPTNPEPNNASTTSHTIVFSTASTDVLSSFKFDYCTTASGSCSTPTNLDVDDVNISVTSFNVQDGGTWAENVIGDVNTVVIGLTAGTAETPTAGQGFQLVISGVTNQDLGDCDEVSGISDTCYVRIGSYASADGSGTAIDSTTTTVTVVADVTVTATVDPSFTFTVGPVDTSVASNQITTTVSTTFDTLPFSNIAAGTPEYAAHTLTVTTNAQSGYSIYSRMTTQMAGAYTDNNIDAFKGLWASPSTWTEPDGTTPNTDTGWFGANTTDTDVTGWKAADSPNGKFGGVLSTGDGVLVSYSTTSDNGSSAVYVTYGIEVNYRQPADTYTGTLQYTALPSY